MNYVIKTNLKADECLDIYNFDIYFNQFITPKNAFCLNKRKECKV